MKIGVGLPASIPNVPSGDFVTEWAKRAEELGFSSLGLIDRVVFTNYEPLVTLAAAAAVTKRIRLMTTILLAPTRETTLLAKQAATIDRLSNGRLTLGLGIGSRKDDFDATGQEFGTRGRRFENQLELMKKIWNGERIGDSAGQVGPLPVQKGGPELLIGGRDPRAIERIGRFAQGYISGGGADPNMVSSIYRAVEESWKKNGREGKPRLVCSFYFALGNNPRERGSPYLRTYYGGFAEYLLKGLLSDSSRIRETIDSFSRIGADELMFWPTIPEMEQLELLSKALPAELLG